MNKIVLRNQESRDKMIAQGYDSKGYAGRMTNYGKKPWIGGSTLTYTTKAKRKAKRT